METPLFTPLNLLYIVLAAGFIWFAVSNYIDHRREVKQKIEIHKLNIEKVKLEIEILKKHNADQLAANGSQLMVVADKQNKFSITIKT